MPIAGRPDVDVLIFGAGLAGAASALALQQAGVDRVAILGRSPRRDFQVGEAAPPDVAILLRRLGIEEPFARAGHAPYYGNLSAWGTPAVAVEDFLRRGLGHGWHLDRARFDRMLLTAAIERGAILIDDARITSIERRDAKFWLVRYDSGEGAVELSAHVLMVATGRSVPPRLRFGARLHRLDRLVGLAAIGTPIEEAGFAGYSLVEAIESGWWYAARLPSGAAIVTLMTDQDLAAAHGLREPVKFLRAWESSRVLRRFVRAPGAACKIATFSAATQYLGRGAGPGWFAVGDALMAFDPLSASGIGGALNDAIDAADAIRQTRGDSGAIDGEEAAARYCRRAEQMLQRFLSQRRDVYARERRWPDSVFWQRRIGAVAFTDPL